MHPDSSIVRNGVQKCGHRFSLKISIHIDTNDFRIRSNNWAIKMILLCFDSHFFHRQSAWIKNRFNHLFQLNSSYVHVRASLDNKQTLMESFQILFQKSPCSMGLIRTTSKPSSVKKRCQNG